jgi:hypothetical protein
MPTPGKKLLNKASARKISILSSPEKSAASNTPSTEPGSNVSGTSASLPKSTTAASIKKVSKGLKSRFSELFSSRSRNTVYTNTSGDNNGYTTIVDEEENVNPYSDVETIPVPANRVNRTSKLLTTYRNSGMNAKVSSTNNIRGDEKSPFMGKKSDREPSGQKQRRKHDEQRVNTATENIDRAIVRQGVTRGVIRVDRSDDESPAPPPARNGPTQNYDENENPDTAVEKMTEEEFDLYLESQLNTAEANLNAAIGAANGTSADEESMTRITDVIQALGASIMTSRQALMAGIGLRAATVNLIEHTATRAAGVREAVAETTCDLST